MPWELNGNNIDPNNFLGTRNNQPLIIRTNNTERMRIAANGDVGIGTSQPSQRLSLGSGNVQLPNAQVGNDGNLYFGGRTDAQETGMRLFGGNVNNQIPGGFIDVRTTSDAEGLRIRVDTAAGGTEKMRITPNNIQAFVPIVQPSDVRAKTNIRQLDGVLDKLVCIHGVSFDWTESSQVLGGSRRSSIGVIAQEVETVFPEFVSEYGDLGYKAVDYSGLSAVLIEAVKELKTENNELRSRVQVLEQLETA
jgi:hypothetical protein